MTEYFYYMVTEDFYILPKEFYAIGTFMFIESTDTEKHILGVVSENANGEFLYEKYENPLIILDWNFIAQKSRLMVDKYIYKGWAIQLELSSISSVYSCANSIQIHFLLEKYIIHLLETLQQLMGGNLAYFDFSITEYIRTYTMLCEKHAPVKTIKRLLCQFYSMLYNLYYSISSKDSAIKPIEQFSGYDLTFFKNLGKIDTQNTLQAINEFHYLFNKC